MDAPVLFSTHIRAESAAELALEVSFDPTDLRDPFAPGRVTRVEMIASIDMIGSGGARNRAGVGRGVIGK